MIGTSRIAFLFSCALSTMAAASELTLSFTVDDQMAGARPWDGTGVSSSALDSGSGEQSGDGGFSGALKNMIPFADLGAQAGLDQINNRMAPADPYLCLIVPPDVDFRCEQPGARRDQPQFDARLGEPYASASSFGIVLLDSDQGNPFGGGDDLIGYGVFLDERTLEAVRAGDAAARAEASAAVESVERLVSTRFNVSRSLTGQGSRVALSRVSISRCAPSCRFGDANLTITRGVDGW